MEATAIVTFLALGQFILFGIQVGSLRARHGVKAPATAGHEEFERMFRVHQNTLEQLVVFLPALWLRVQPDVEYQGRQDFHCDHQYFRPSQLWAHVSAGAIRQLRSPAQ